jgi:predicted acylesterase/phospholipase RssA
LTVNINVLSLLRGSGSIFSNYYIFNQIESLIKSKNLSTTITFKDHFEITKMKLVITAFNVTRQKEEIFAFDTTPNMSIVYALKLSSGIPIVFKKLTFNNDVYVDGAVWDNFPIELGLKYGSTIFAITTVYSIYKSSIKKWYGNKNINFVMVNDDKNIIPALVSTDLVKYHMFMKGFEKTEMIKKVMAIPVERFRRKSI